LILPHSYKNYAHLEGVLEEDAMVVSTPDGQAVRFTLVVLESGRDSTGVLIKKTESFPIEVGHRESKFAATLKKGVPVMVDARIKIRRRLIDGVQHSDVTLKAHRVHPIDYSGWKKGIDQNGWIVD
jgi:single-stranded DNA-binding protein